MDFGSGKLLPRVPRRLLLPLGLTAGLIVVLIVWLKPIGFGRTSEAAASPGSQAASGLLDENPECLAAAAAIATARGPREYAVAGARDPMNPLVKERASRSQPAREPQEPTVTLPVRELEGIVWDDNNPVAMIDGVDLRIGDEIRGAKIKEIGFDRVVLVYRSKQFVLTVE